MCPRIAFLINHFSARTGGTEGQFYELLRHLDPDEFTARVFVPYRTTPYLDEQGLPCPHEILDLPRLTPRNVLHFLRVTTARIRAFEPDIVHTWFSDSILVGPLLKSATGARLVSSRRDLGYWYTRLNLLWLRLSRPANDLYICNSDAVRDRLLAAERAAPRKSIVIRNCIDLDEIDAIAPIDVAARYGLPPDVAVIGVIANVRPVKRVTDAIAGVGRLVERGENVALLLLGDNIKRRDQLAELARQSHLAGRFVMPGQLPREQTIGHIKGCRIACNCSQTEGFSNAVLEYQACRVPIVASDNPGNAELIDHGVHGRLYPVGDVAALAETLSATLADPAAAAAMTVAARRRVEGRHEAAQVADQYARHYRSLVRARHDRHEALPEGETS